MVVLKASVEKLRWLSTNGDRTNSKDNERPLTLQHSAMTWSPRDIVSMDQAFPHSPIHSSTSYADFDQPAHGQHRTQEYANRHGIPSDMPREFHDQPILDYHVGTPTPHRTMTTPGEIYHITEPGNPGILTMANTARPHQHLLQQVERPPVELPYPTLTIAAPTGTSPRIFSITSISGSGVQECLCKYMLEHEPEYTQAGTQQSIIPYQQYTEPYKPAPAASDLSGTDDSRACI
ncbi:krab domain protein [Fusarium beomiforme]|uniref:Krab domain protein n=1 Tax=Fusarium beomiforme TaxID=44412 RepID=A0A9P5AUJ6_9HYPO|nr:krab domain protein [Fusarium beomiforme]